MRLEELKLAKEDSTIFNEVECHHLNCVYIFLERLNTLWQLPKIKENNIETIHFNLTPTPYADIEDIRFWVKGLFDNTDMLNKEMQKIMLTDSLRELDMECMPYNGNLAIYQFTLKKDTPIEDILTENLLNKKLFDKVLKSTEINFLKKDLDKIDLKSQKKNKI